MLCKCIEIRCEYRKLKFPITWHIWLVVTYIFFLETNCNSLACYSLMLTVLVVCWSFWWMIFFSISLSRAVVRSFPLFCWWIFWSHKHGFNFSFVSLGFVVHYILIFQSNFMYGTESLVLIFDLICRVILRQFRVRCRLRLEYMIFLISQIDIEFSLSTNNVLRLLLLVYWMKCVDVRACTFRVATLFRPICSHEMSTLAKCHRRCL